MPNQQMIDSWDRGQSHYSQARHYTPGHQRTQYRTTERGRPRPMDLLVVVHNDVPPSDLGTQRVDLIVNSGRFDRAAEHPNGHLVNAYDERAGVTDHTALYSDADMARIHQASGGPVEMRDREGGGPPGAQIYSVRANVRENERAELVVDTSAPMERGSGASRYSLHDVQEGMDQAARRDGLQDSPGAARPQPRTGQVPVYGPGAPASAPRARGEHDPQQQERLPGGVPVYRPGASTPARAQRPGAVPVYGTGLTAEQRAHHERESALRGQSDPRLRGVNLEIGVPDPSSADGTAGRRIHVRVDDRERHGREAFGLVDGQVAGVNSPVSEAYIDRLRAAAGSNTDPIVDREYGARIGEVLRVKGDLVPREAIPGQAGHGPSLGVDPRSLGPSDHGPRPSGQRYVVDRPGQPPRLEGSRATARAQERLPGGVPVYRPDGPTPRPPSGASASSQAGLSSVRAGAQFGSAPPPGQPGSRFNPVVRERGEARRSSAPPAQEADDMHHFRDDRTGQVISMSSGRLAKKGQPEGLRRMSAEEHRLHRADVEERLAQRTAGRAGPAAAQDRPTRSPASDRSAFAADVLGRTGEVLDGKAPAAEEPVEQEQRPLSERFDYRFDEPESPSGTESQLGD